MSSSGQGLELKVTPSLRKAAVYNIAFGLLGRSKWRKGQENMIYKIKTTANGIPRMTPQSEVFTLYVSLPVQNGTEITARSVIEQQKPLEDKRFLRRDALAETMNGSWVPEGPEAGRGMGRAGEHFSPCSHLPKTKGIHSRLVPRSS